MKVAPQVHDGGKSRLLKMFRPPMTAFRKEGFEARTHSNVKTGSMTWLKEATPQIFPRFVVDVLPIDLKSCESTKLA
jgi:hypothetical protein